MARLDEKIALVTGAARGIGAAIAKKLAESGALVYINYSSSDEAANKVKKEIEECGGCAKLCKCDVSNSADTKQMIEEIIKSEGKIDILVNNAGITRDNLIMGMKEEDFDAVIDVNLKGSFNTIWAVSRYMLKKRYGRIINISSVSGVMGNAGQINYSASKAGVIGMTKSAARELASRNITVNAIAPGFIKSDMTDVLPDNVKQTMQKSIPLGCFGEPEDIANIVDFLSGDEGRYITGQVISVDGGMNI